MTGDVQSGRRDKESPVCKDVITNAIEIPISQDAQGGGQRYCQSFLVSEFPVSCSQQSIRFSMSHLHASGTRGETVAFSCSGVQYLTQLVPGLILLLLNGFAGKQ